MQLSIKNGTFDPELTAERLKMCAVERNLTKGEGTPNLVKISDISGVDRRTIGKLISAKADAVKSETLRDLATALSVPYGYLTGEHNYSSEAQYMEAKEQSIADQRKLEDSERATFFRTLGYHFYIRGSAQFEQAGGNPGLKRCLISSVENPDSQQYLSASELKKIVEYLSLQLAFAVSNLDRL